MAMQMPTVSIKAATWKRETHGLFDYEAPTSKIEKERFEVQQFPVTLNRRADSVTVQTDAPAVFPETTESLEHLVRVNVKGDAVIVEPSKISTQGKPVDAHKLFKVVRDANEVPLHAGSQIKLGRARLRVKQIVPLPAASTAEGAASVASVLDIFQKAARKGSCNTSDELKDDQCRICLGYGSTEEDGPLLQPCDCQGSIKHVHLNCLRDWIDTKQSLSGNGRNDGYFFRPPSCELCKKTYCSSMTDKKDGTEFPVVSLPKTKAPYIVLEQESAPDDKRGAYVLSLASKDIVKLGRGRGADVLCKDVSLSRCHATIRYDKDKGEFLLKDNDSKFGTLIRVKKAVSLTKGEELNLQLGRSRLQIRVDAPPSAGS